MAMVKYMSKKVFADLLMIKVICDVTFHASLNFDKTSILGITRAGEVFTVVDFRA